MQLVVGEVPCVHPQLSGGQSCDGSVRLEEMVVLPVGERRVAVQVVCQCL